MLVPLCILALCAIFVGFIPFGHFVSSDGKILSTEFHLLFSIGPVLIAVLGIALATLLYKKKTQKQIVFLKQWDYFTMPPTRNFT